MQLNFQVFPDGLEVGEIKQTPLLIVPGLFGSISNWRTVARALSVNRPVIVIDQRNHGRSPHAPTHSYADMVADLHGFCVAHGLSKIDLAGHSMGGKVAMLFALEHDDLLESLIVLDVAPIRYSHSHAPFLQALLEVDLSAIESRSVADRQLKDVIPDTATRMFLLQSLAGSPGNYHWRLNLSVLSEYMEEIVGFPKVEGDSSVETLIMAGELSTYLLPEHRAGLAKLFPNSQFVSVSGAGHWLHAEQPKQVAKLIEEFLQQ